MGLILRILTRIRQQLLGGGRGKLTNLVTWVLQSLPIFLANFDSQNLKFTFSIFGMSYFEHGMPPHPYETIHCNVWLLVTLSKLEWWERWVGVVWCVAQRVWAAVGGRAECRTMRGRCSKAEVGLTSSSRSPRPAFLAPTQLLCDRAVTQFLQVSRRRKHPYFEWLPWKPFLNAIGCGLFAKILLFFLAHTKIS